MTTKKIEFGIDCDPFCRHQQEFADQVSKQILGGQEIKCISKCFGAWEFTASVNQVQRDQIWNLMSEYYSAGKCRGAFCQDPWK